MEMLQKGAIVKVRERRGQILSSIFVVPKKDGSFRPVINLKHLNIYILYTHSKMESLSLLKELLQQGNLMCKLDPKDAYFSVPIQEMSRESIRFMLGWYGWQFLKTVVSRRNIRAKAIQLISASRRKSTVSRYESAWSSWCRRKQS